MELKEILELYKGDPEELFKEADRVCRSHYGDKVFLRGLVEFSNYCVQDCLYCGIRRSNASVQRYRLEFDQIVDIIKSGFQAGLRTFVLQSGEDPYYTNDFLCRLLLSVKEFTAGDAAVTLSCGIRSRKQYQELKAAGADRYLIRFETSDPSLHQYLRDGITLERRLQAIRDLTELGFEIGSGFMVGLPGETEETRIQNALLCRELKLNMVGIGPFIPHPETPLNGAEQLPVEHTLRIVALVRLLLPEANIPATTALGTLDPLGREKAMEVGANVLMPNITPSAFKKNYLLYPGKICLDESGLECIGCLKLRTGNIGKELSFDIGFSKSFKNREVFCAD